MHNWTNSFRQLCMFVCEPGCFYTLYHGLIERAVVILIVLLHNRAYTHVQLQPVMSLSSQWSVECSKQ